MIQIARICYCCAICLIFLLFAGNIDPLSTEDDLTRMFNTLQEGPNQPILNSKVKFILWLLILSTPNSMSIYTVPTSMFLMFINVN